MIGSYRASGPITPACVAVLAGAARGETMAQTAGRLHVSRHTVEAERRVAIARLGARNTTHAVAIAIRAGLLDE